LDDLATAVATFESTYSTYYNESGSDSSSSSRKMVKRLRTSSSLGSFPVTSGIYLYGTDTTNDTVNPTWCDHFHLYSFGYDSVTLEDTSDDSTWFTVDGTSMIGFPNACSYVNWLGISSTFTEGDVVATTGDQFAWTCGYYVTYEWDGYGDLWFEVSTMGAAHIAGAISLATIGSLLF